MVPETLRRAQGVAEDEVVVVTGLAALAAAVAGVTAPVGWEMVEAVVKELAATAVVAQVSVAAVEMDPGARVVEVAEMVVMLAVAAVVAVVLVAVVAARVGEPTASAVEETAAEMMVVERTVAASALMVESSVEETGVATLEVDVKAVEGLVVAATVAGQMEVVVKVVAAMALVVGVMVVGGAEQKGIARAEA